MEKHVRLDATQFEGIAVTVHIDGKLEDYAKALLHIFNNVREDKFLYKVRNFYYSDDITVYASKDSKRDLVEYLEQFGTIKRIDKVLMLSIPDYQIDYDFDEYDDLELVPEFE